MNKLDAQKLVEAFLNADARDYEVAIINEATLEKDFGWIFFYDLKSSSNGDQSELLAGNAPIIVDRESGELVITGTAYPIEHYVHQYRISRSA